MDLTDFKQGELGNNLYFASCRFNGLYFYQTTSNNPLPICCLKNIVIDALVFDTQNLCINDKYLYLLDVKDSKCNIKYINDFKCRHKLR